MSKPKPKYVKVSDFCSHFNVTRQAVYKMIQRGEVPVVRLGLRIIRIPASYLEEVEAQAITKTK